MSEAATSDSSSRRHLPRASFGGHADLFTWDGRSRARVTDLSGSGAYLLCRDPLPEGKYITLRLRLPGGRAYTVLGRVVRSVRAISHTSRQSGMGLRFVDLSFGARRAIQAYVGGHSA